MDKGVFVQRTASGVFAIVMPEGKYLNYTGEFSQGFECGYQGQGPTELAYCILKHYYPLADSLNVRGLVFDVIAKIDILAGQQFFISEKTIKMIQEDIND